MYCRLIASFFAASNVIKTVYSRRLSRAPFFFFFKQSVRSLERRARTTDRPYVFCTRRERLVPAFRHDDAVRPSTNRTRVVHNARRYVVFSVRRRNDTQYTYIIIITRATHAAPTGTAINFMTEKISNDDDDGLIICFSTVGRLKTGRTRLWVSSSRLAEKTVRFTRTCFIIFFFFVCHL